MLFKAVIIAYVTRFHDVSASMVPSYLDTFIALNQNNIKSDKILQRKDSRKAKCNSKYAWLFTLPNHPFHHQFPCNPLFHACDM